VTSAIPVTPASEKDNRLLSNDNVFTMYGQFKGAHRSRKVTPRIGKTGIQNAHLICVPNLERSNNERAMEPCAVGLQK